MHLRASLDISKIYFFAVGVPLVGDTQIVSEGHEMERDSKQRRFARVMLFESLPE